MSGDRLATLAFVLIALTLPLSSLIARRMAIGATARLAAIWFAIIVGGVALVAAVRDGSVIWTKLHVLIRTNDSADASMTAISTLHNIYYQDD